MLPHGTLNTPQNYGRWSQPSTTAFVANRIHFRSSLYPFLESPTRSTLQATHHSLIYLKRDCAVPYRDWPKQYAISHRSMAGNGRDSRQRDSRQPVDISSSGPQGYPTQKLGSTDR